MSPQAYLVRFADPTDKPFMRVVRSPDTASAAVKAWQQVSRRPRWRQYKLVGITECSQWGGTDAV